MHRQTGKVLNEDWNMRAYVTSLHLLNCTSVSAEEGGGVWQYSRTQQAC